MTLTFRNVDVDPSSAVQDWPHEAVVTLIERGSVTDWSRLTAALRDDPWGPLARHVEDYLSYARPAGVAGLLERALARARHEREQAERAAVATRVEQLISESGLSIAEFASRIGTSRSRLSTYRSGRVTPSAALLLRMERLVGGDAVR